jgi:hypothetical protein
MEKVAIAFLAVVGIVFAAPLLGVLGGAFSGWVVGFFWTQPILDFLARVGVRVEGLEVWQIGAAMGFLGGFLKTNVPVKSD